MINRSASTLYTLHRRSKFQNVARIVAMTTALLGLMACADRPTAVGFIAQPQQHLQAVAHWQVVANDVASAVSAYLEKETGKKEPVAIYFMRDPGTLFSEGFVGAMQTCFVSLGHPVAIDDRPEVVTVAVDVMIVPHAKGNKPSRTFPGPMTALGVGVGVAAYMWDSFPWGVTAAALGLTADAAMSKPPETDTEMVLTVSLVRDGFYTFRSSAVYYINAPDLWHYQSRGGVSGLMAAGSLNDVPLSALSYDLAGKPFITPVKR